MPSVFPFTAHAKKTLPGKKKLPVFREYAYDFEGNCLKLRAGRPYLVEKDEALKIWIYHALRVPRYIFPAHSHEYGNELESLTGCAGGREVTESETRRYITEAVMVNPYIQELGGFRFEHGASAMKVTFEVTTLYGRFTHESEVYNE